MFCSQGGLYGGYSVQPNCVCRWFVWWVQRSAEVCVCVRVFQMLLYCHFVERDSSVCIATRHGLDGPGIEYLWVTRFSALVQTDPGAHPASYIMGTGSFPGVKRPGPDANHPPHLAPMIQSSAIVLLPLAFMSCYR